MDERLEVSILLSGNHITFACSEVGKKRKGCGGSRGRRGEAAGEQGADEERPRGLPEQGP
uniref:Uncharacterized protein n=1 Tax=Arundo donax TaxID=35708 RepID=A0A0A9AD72_ARUDO